MTSAADRARHAQAVGEILALMSKCGLALDDLIRIGGEDLKSSNPKRSEKARRVEKCWSLMARLSVRFAGRIDARPAIADRSGTHDRACTQWRRGRAVREALSSAGILVVRGSNRPRNS